MLLTEIGQHLIVVGTRDGGFADFRGIALHLHCLAGFEHHIGLCEVGIKQREEHRTRELTLIGELAVNDTNRVDRLHAAVIGVGIELCVGDIGQFALKPCAVLSRSASRPGDCRSDKEEKGGE